MSITLKPDYLHRKLEEIQTKYNGLCDGYDLCIPIFGVGKHIYKAETFNGFIDIPFEGKMFSAVKDYDSVLKTFYGDYMRLPDITNRISHHNTVKIEI